MTPTIRQIYISPYRTSCFSTQFHVPTAERTQSYLWTLITWDLVSIRPRNRTPDLYAFQRITETVPRQRHVHWQLLCTLSTILPTDTSRRSMAIDSRASIDHYLDDNTERPGRGQEEKEEKEEKDEKEVYHSTESVRASHGVMIFTWSQYIEWNPVPV